MCPHSHSHDAHPLVPVFALVAGGCSW
jgi:hypothetical protein